MALGRRARAFPAPLGGRRWRGYGADCSRGKPGTAAAGTVAFSGRLWRGTPAAARTLSADLPDPATDGEHGPQRNLMPEALAAAAAPAQPRPLHPRLITSSYVRLRPRSPPPRPRVSALVKIISLPWLSHTLRLRAPVATSTWTSTRPLVTEAATSFPCAPAELCRMPIPPLHPPWVMLPRDA